MANPYRPIQHSQAVDGFQATALVGSSSAIVAWSAEKQDIAENLLGFAIKRTDFDSASGNEIKSDFLPSLKRFKGIKEDVKTLGSNEAPFQRFRWNDYGLNPKKRYRYDIFPVLGEPGTTAMGNPMSVDVVPSLPVMDNIGVFFNRGVTSAHAYLSRFGGKHPDEVANNEAYEWLSRGLKESLLLFIAETKPGQQLHVCIYEFFDIDVAAALAAVKSKVDVKIIYHAKAGDKATGESAENIAHHKLTKLALARTQTRAISHNKFAVRLEAGKPVSLWTGSSNFSSNAFYFQTNSALLIGIPEIAQIYEDYFQVLLTDPELSRKKKNVEFAQDKVAAINAAFRPLPPFSRVLFSPVRNIDLLDLAVEMITSAQSAVFISAPFAMEAPLVEALKKNRAATLEYGLSNVTVKKKLEGLKVKHTRFLVPSVLKTFMGKEWDAKAFGDHKIHSKMIVTDPWSNNPRVFVGSSNHSDESCNKNDENNLLIEKDARVAAIMSTEFMRMFDHYNSRDFINAIEAGQSPDDKFLKDDARWARTAYDDKAKSHKFRDRQVFSGQE